MTISLESLKIFVFDGQVVEEEWEVINFLSLPLTFLSDVINYLRFKTSKYI